MTGGSDKTHHLVRSINSLRHEELIQLCGPGTLVWGIRGPNRSGGDRGEWWPPLHSLRNYFPYDEYYFTLKIEDCHFRQNNACRYLGFLIFVVFMWTFWFWKHFLSLHILSFFVWLSSIFHLWVFVIEKMCWFFSRMQMEYFLY